MILKKKNHAAVQIAAKKVAFVKKTVAKKVAAVASGIAKALHPLRGNLVGLTNFLESLCLVSFLCFQQRQHYYTFLS